MTNDFERRLEEHVLGTDGKCYTVKRRPVKLIYRAEFREVNDAIAWEKTVKGWSRAKKEAMMRGDQEALEKAARSGYRIHIDTIRENARQSVILSSTKDDLC
jgi:putative endonuclease